MRFKLAFTIMLCMLFLIPVTGLAQAQTSSYIQINNGQIRTHSGQQFQVVTQFGNRSQATIEGAVVACFWAAELGALGRVHAGPFNVTDFISDGTTSVVGGNIDFTEIVNEDLVYGFVFEGVDLRPGQNYNFAFNIVAGDAGASGQVSCVLQSGYTRLSDTQTQVRVH